MKYSRLLVMSALAGSLALPATAMAQGSSNYGIFGNGTGQSGGFNNSGASGSFGRGGFGQSGFSNSSQMGMGGGIGGLGRTSALGAGSGNVVSPYLNLLRPGNGVAGAAINYYGLVRPQVRQDAINTQYSNNIQQADRMLTNQQQFIQQNLEPLLNPAEAPATSNLRTEPTNQPEPRRRVATASKPNNADADFHDWASDFKDQSIVTDPRLSLDSRQREAKLRQAKELKELEKELLGESNSSTDTTASAPSSAAQSRGRSISPFPGATGLNSLRPTSNHYFPAQGATSRGTGVPR